MAGRGPGEEGRGRERGGIEGQKERREEERKRGRGWLGTPEKRQETERVDGQRESELFYYKHGSG